MAPELLLQKTLAHRSDSDPSGNVFFEPPQLPSRPSSLWLLLTCLGCIPSRDSLCGCAHVVKTWPLLKLPLCLQHTSDMLPKRKTAQAGIAASLAKAQAAASGKKLPPVEATAFNVRTVNQNYVEETNKQYEGYIKERTDRAAQLERAAEVQAAATPATAGLPLAAASMDFEAQDPTADHNAALVASRWQKKAAYCTDRMAVWAGSDVALQPSLQEQLTMITLNHHLHPDPTLSLKAYQLLLQNLQQHPPVRAAPTSEGEPYLLEVNDQCWHPLSRSLQTTAIAETILAGPAGTKALAGLPTEFAMFQSLITNAVLLVTGNENSSNISQRASSGSAPSQGKALVLLYLVQLLHSDANTRLAVFEQHMHSAAAGNLSQEEVAEVLRRAATVLQHSVLYRLLAADLVWRDSEDDRKGKHRLVRDLVLLVTTDLDYTADIVPPATPPSAGTASTSDAAAQAQPVSAPELVSAARRLLLLMLDLYSNCEAAGVYGGGSHLHSSSRNFNESDRCWLDIVMMKAIGALGAGHMLQGFKRVAGSAALERLLQFLPPVHRVRLAALVVAVTMHRGYDRDTTKKDPLLAVFQYYEVKGKGNADCGPDCVRSNDIAKALTDRPWLVKELLGGKEAWGLRQWEAGALLLSTFAHAALIGKQLPDPQEQEEFKKLAKPLLQGVLPKNKSVQAKDSSAGLGYSDVIFTVGSALQLLEA